MSELGEITIRPVAAKLVAVRFENGYVVPIYRDMSPKLTNGDHK